MSMGQRRTDDGLLERVEAAVVHRLQADPDFEGAPTIPIVSEGDKDYARELEKRVLAGMAFLLVTADMLDEPVRGKPATIRVLVLAIEHVLHNRGSSGSKVTARQLIQMAQATLRSEAICEEAQDAQGFHTESKAPPGFLGQDAETNYLVYGLTFTLTTVLGAK
jgi:hypothetical protein